MIGTTQSLVVRNASSLLVGLWLAGVGLSASADTLSYANEGFGNQPITLKFANNAQQSSFVQYSVSAGSLTGTLTPTVGSPSSFTMYCIDPLTWANQNQTYTDLPLGTYLTNTSPTAGYTTQFAQGAPVGSGPATSYQLVAPGGYDDQSASTVQTRLSNLYRYAYADSLTSADIGARF